MPKIEIPASLTSYSAGASVVTMASGTLAAVMAQLEREHPALYQNLVTNGSFRPFVRVFANGRSVSLTTDRELTLVESDVLRILMAVAGG